MTYAINEIEDALLAALEPLKAELGVKTIKHYDGDLVADDLVKLTAHFPALYVVYGGSVVESQGARDLETFKFIVFACDKSLRSEAEARRGSAHGPGVYALLQGVRDKLRGRQLLPELFPARLTRQNAALYDKGVSIYTANYEVRQGLGIV